MRQKAITYGSEFADFPSLVVEPVELFFRPDTKWGTIGFRLVSDSLDRVNRGSMWNFAVRGNHRGTLPPDFHYAFLGFRLTKEST